MFFLGSAADFFAWKMKLEMFVCLFFLGGVFGGCFSEIFVGGNRETMTLSKFIFPTIPARCESNFQRKEWQEKEGGI